MSGYHLVNLIDMKLMRYIFIAYFILTAVSLFAQNDTTVTFKVFGVCAAYCKPRIETAAKGRGVNAAVWNADTKMLMLSYDASKTTLEKIQNRIVDAGHDLENKKADNAVYKALPACCYYRQMQSNYQLMKSKCHHAQHQAR